MNAVAAFTSMRRILEVVKDDVALFEIETIMDICILHSLSVEGVDSLDEGIDCINILLKHAYKDRAISPQLWAYFPLLLSTISDTGTDQEEAHGFECVN